MRAVKFDVHYHNVSLHQSFERDSQRVLQETVNMFRKEKIVFYIYRLILRAPLILDQPSRTLRCFVSFLKKNLCGPFGLETNEANMQTAVQPQLIVLYVAGFIALKATTVHLVSKPTW